MSLQFVVNKPRGPLGWWIMIPIGGLTVAALWWSAVGTRLSISGFIDGLPWIGDFIGRMLPRMAARVLDDSHDFPASDLAN